MAEMHECAVEALEVSGCDGPIDAIGHSMGGLALLAFALDRPDRVRRLVLVGTGSGGRALMAAPGGLHRPGHPGFARMALLGMLQLVWPFRAPEQMVLGLVERASFVDGRHVRPRRISPADWLRRREGRADWHWIARRTDYAPRLGEIRAPTLVLVGRHDPQFPMACSDELHARIEDSRLNVLERSGHYPFIEEPQAFWTAVDDFLAAGEATK
jgi:pimeloyl-ACP methyl ester carboxylesterase